MAGSMSLKGDASLCSLLFAHEVSGFVMPHVLDIMWDLVSTPPPVATQS